MKNPKEPISLWDFVAEEEVGCSGDITPRRAFALWFADKIIMGAPTVLPREEWANSFALWDIAQELKRTMVGQQKETKKHS